MWSADHGLLAATLRDAHGWACLLLFVGALLETVLPFALLVPGEWVFLAGAMMAGAGQLPLLPVTLSLLGGGLLGDQLSYWLGRRYGRNVLTWLQRRRWLSRVLASHRRALAWLRLRGGRAVFLARFGGPLSWIMPTMAGAGRMRYARFVAWNVPAVLLGIGQFIALGYLAGRGIRLWSPPADLHGWWLLIPGLAVAVLWVIRKRRKRPA
jgi:membrane-associated protein